LRLDNQPGDEEALSAAEAGTIAKPAVRSEVHVMKFLRPAPRPSRPPLTGSLDGPSRTITVEPVEAPVPAPPPEIRPEREPEKQPKRPAAPTR
jgi:hypothetical protein